jgi:hypothetical protein
MALRIMKHEDEPVAAPKETSVRSVLAGEVEAPAAEVIVSRTRSSAAAQKSARKKHQPGKAKAKAGSPRETLPGSKNGRISVWVWMETMILNQIFKCRNPNPFDALAVLQNGLSKSERMKTHSLPVVVGGGRTIVEFHLQLLSSCVFCSGGARSGV